MRSPDALEHLEREHAECRLRLRYRRVAIAASAGQADKRNGETKAARGRILDLVAIGAGVGWGYRPPKSAPKSAGSRVASTRRTTNSSDQKGFPTARELSD
jgi:hypothetical protein